MDEHAFESYRMETVERAEELAAWANQHWRTAPDATILRLKVIDQVDREISGLPSRLDLMDIHPAVKAYKAELAEEAARAAKTEKKQPEPAPLRVPKRIQPERKRPAPEPLTPLEILKQRVRERGEYEQMLTEIRTLTEKTTAIAGPLEELKTMDQRIQSFSLARTLEPLYGADAPSAAEKIQRIQQEKGLIPIIQTLDKNPAAFGSVVPESRARLWNSAPVVPSVAERVQQVVRSMRDHNSARLHAESAYFSLRATLLAPNEDMAGMIQLGSTRLTTMEKRIRLLDYKKDFHPGRTLDAVQNAYKDLSPADREVAHRTIEALGSMLPAAPKAPLSGPAQGLSPAPKEKGSKGFSL